jgi:membrane peptidoglycan carboxypeptidase
MRKMMEGVVLETYGTGRRARLIGYTAGGKTGSAQIFDFNVRQYRHGYYNASFAGFAPLTNPSIVVVVTLNGAREYGGAVAAPVFREVAMGALRLLDVPKDLPDEPLPDERRVEDNDVAIAEIAAPPVSREELLASGPDAEGSEPEPPRVASGPRVPDFHGKSMRSVMEESAAIGLRVDLVGSGLARAQIPAPGSVLTPGERVRVHFAR